MAATSPAMRWIVAVLTALLLGAGSLGAALILDHGTQLATHATAIATQRVETVQVRQDYARIDDTLKRLDAKLDVKLDALAEQMRQIAVPPRRPR